MRAAAAAAPQVRGRPTLAQRPDGRAAPTTRRSCASRRCGACAPRNDADVVRRGAGGDRRSRPARRAVRPRSARRLRRRRPTRSPALERTVADLSDAGSARGWHRAAHALVALAAAAPRSAAAAMLPQFTGSRDLAAADVRGARGGAARRIARRSTTLARDEDDNVREAAVEGLRKLAGHDADAVYVSAALAQRAIRSCARRRWRSKGRRIRSWRVPALQGRVAAAGRGGPRQLARRARRDREDADRRSAQPVSAPKSRLARGRRRRI